jgi:hypothetical protein
MPSDGVELLRSYKRIDAQLAARGFHPTSEAWMRTLEAFWLSDRRRLVIRKGRQGGGSTTMARVAAITGLFGKHRIAKGSRGVFAFVSIRKDEAAERLENIAQVFDAIGVKYERTEYELVLVGKPILFRSLTCTTRERGTTMIGLVEDEMSSWSNSDGSANPASEVDSALTPALITQANGRIYSISSPLGSLDYHAELFDLGDTAHQMTACGPSWFWNPTLSEADTHDLQPNERVWRREFAAIPSASASSVFSEEALRACFVPQPRLRKVSNTIMAIDANSGGQCDFAFAIGAWCQRVWSGDWKDKWVCRPIIRSKGDGLIGPANDRIPIQPLTPNPDYGSDKLVFVVEAVGAFTDKSLAAADIVGELAALDRKLSIVDVVGDQREQYALASMFKAEGLRFTPIPWTAPLKVETVSHGARLIEERRIVFPADESLLREMLQFEERITPSGISYAGKGRTDRTSAILTLLMADFKEGMFTGSPAHPRNKSVRYETPLVSAYTGR